MEKLIKLIEGLIEIKFYGSIEVKFENGNIVVVRKIESIKV